MKRDMRKYILRKLVELIFTLLFVTLLSFLLMRLSSVDPATAYAKRMIGNPTAEQIEKIRIQLGFDKPLDLMDAVHMDYGLLETPVRQLSGGEQRRLSLLRAIAVEPDYLIMDEVTSGLDLISADAVLTLVENFVKLSGSSCIFITHSRKDAMRIANRIIIMREGRIAEQGYLIDQLSNQKGQG